MIFKYLASGAVALSALAVAPANACSSCGCTLTSDWLSQGLVAQPQTTVTLRYDYVPQTELRGGGGVIDRNAIALPAGREIERYTDNHYVTASLDRQFDPVWGLNIQVPYLYRPHATVSPGDTDQSFSRTNGLGDIRLTARWQGFGGPGITGLQFGFKLPTGSFRQTFRAGPGAGSDVDRGLQPGSGTTDALIGVYHFGRLVKDVDFILQAIGEVPLDNRDLYRPGLSANISAGLHYVHWRGITPQVQFNLRLAEQDHGLNADRDNSGGELLYAAPGLIAALSRRASAFAYVQLPVYQRVEGYQLAPKVTISVGVNYRL